MVELLLGLLVLLHRETEGLLDRGALTLQIERLVHRHVPNTRVETQKLPRRHQRHTRDEGGGHARGRSELEVFRVVDGGDEEVRPMDREIEVQRRQIGVEAQLALAEGVS